MVPYTQDLNLWVGRLFKLCKGHGHLLGKRALHVWRFSSFSSFGFSMQQANTYLDALSSGSSWSRPGGKGTRSKDMQQHCGGKQVSRKTPSLLWTHGFTGTEHWRKRSRYLTVVHEEVRQEENKQSLCLVTGMQITGVGVGTRESPVRHRKGKCLKQVSFTSKFCLWSLPP